MNLGRGPQTDLLAVSFSTTDAVGHRFGPDSRELHDQIVRLDRYLGIFIDSLYQLRDSSRIVFALTADHGVAPYPELRAQREHVPRRARRRESGVAARPLGDSAQRTAIPTAIDFEEGHGHDRSRGLRARAVSSPTTSWRRSRRRSGE